jgi:hypothetical protein
VFPPTPPSPASVHRALLALAVGISLPACAAAEIDDPARPEGDPSLEERLARPTTVGVVPSAGGSFARVQAVALRDGSTYEVELGISGGAISLSLDAEGQLRLEGLAAQGDDIQMAQTTLPPEGLTLTGIALELAAPAAAHASTGPAGTMYASAGCALDLRWAVQLEHGVVDLAPIRLAEVPFDLVVGQSADGALEARLTAGQTGEIWSWAGVFELRDLEIDLVGSSDVPAVGEIHPVD